jgi:hypothetical protein
VLLSAPRAVAVQAPRWARATLLQIQRMDALIGRQPGTRAYSSRGADGKCRQYRPACTAPGWVAASEDYLSHSDDQLWYVVCEAKFGET